MEIIAILKEMAAVELKYFVPLLINKLNISFMSPLKVGKWEFLIKTSESFVSEVFFGITKIKSFL